MAAIATFALKPGVWFRRVRLVIVSPDSQRTACLLSGRNSTYRPVQISGTGSLAHNGSIGKLTELLFVFHVQWFVICQSEQLGIMLATEASEGGCAVASDEAEFDCWLFVRG